MRQLQIFVQFFAVLVLLMHSIVPHHHHNELTESKHQQEHLEAVSVLDYLALSLHFDHPEGQLEEFLTAQSDVSDFDQLDQINQELALASAAKIPVFFKENNSFFTHQVDLEHFSTVAHSLRGPPTCA